MGAAGAGGVWDAGVTGVWTGALGAETADGAVVEAAGTVAGFTGVGAGVLTVGVAGAAGAEVPNVGGCTLQADSSNTREHSGARDERRMALMADRKDV